jgi:hypothetical protein
MLSYKFNYADSLSKFCDILPHTLDSVTNKRLRKVDNTGNQKSFLDVVTVVWFVIQNIADLDWCLQFYICIYNIPLCSTN